MMNNKTCRFCSTPLHHSFVNLGKSPIANAFLSGSQLHCMEPFYPLHVFVCDSCFLVQLGEFESPESIFSDYAYFSSYSTTWLQHARYYVNFITDYLKLDKQHYVVEIASNDGYLLQYFVEKGIPVLGIEPAANVAEAAIKKGVPTLIKFFGSTLARELSVSGKQADLVVGNNVLAHVPALNDFVAGLKIILKPQGVITLEFPHLMRLMSGNQFDTIYHEHFSYFSFFTVNKILASHGLKIFDVEELSTHGGSLRIYAAHQEDSSRLTSPRVHELLRREEGFGLTRLATYHAFAAQVKASKREILAFLIQAKETGRQIVGYGAPAKGNTLLNYCGIRTDFLDYTVERNPHKQGLFLPGTLIPIESPEKIRQTKPDYLFILPWNLKEEIMEQMAFIRSWGGKFVIPIPRVIVYD
jgi:SAM-dependent methyltransferase